VSVATPRKSEVFRHLSLNEIAPETLARNMDNQIAPIQSAGYPFEFQEATDEATFSEKNLLCGYAARDWGRCRKRAELRPKVISGDAMEVHRTVPWWKNGGNYGRPRAAESVLYGSGEWRRLEND